MSFSEKLKSDPVFFAEALQNAGSMALLSKTANVPTSTLSDWKANHGVVVKTPEMVAPDAELKRQNDLLKLENAALRRHASTADKIDLQSERLLERISGKLDTFRPSWEALPTKDRNPFPNQAQTLVLPYSDLHAAEVVSLEETGGVNEYNWKIMEDRCKLVLDAAFSHTEHFGFDIDAVQVLMLGDMLSGNIHEELAMTNDRPLAEAVVDLAEFHVDWLLTLADHFDGSKIKVSGVPGNHPRAWKKPQAKHAQDNADWVFYKILEMALKGNPKFEFNFPRGAYNTVMLANRWRALLMHGDGIKSTMPGVPWGGVIRRITTLEAQFVNSRQPLDYVFMGHFHQDNQLSGVHTQTWVNGSVKGADEYSLKTFGQGRPASQQLMTFHEKRGWTGSYAVHLQDFIPANEGWS